MRNMFNKNKTYKKNTYTAKRIKNEIYKKNYIYSIETYEYKIEILKIFFNKHVDIINRLEGSNETIIDDLYNISKISPSKTYIHPSSKTYIRNIIYKYVDEFQYDEDILNLFYYILYISDNI
jgi:hypothetical protein